ncbi:hypothetical protein Scep_024699 [Stephania cephalantha]|uniref:Uncharacterized protein n=1 Tax=Stephania cephalantha TaxID=152367 RepID=A0AAP0EXS6_9MAGN
MHRVVSLKFGDEIEACKVRLVKVSEIVQEGHSDAGDGREKPSECWGRQKEHLQQCYPSQRYTRFCNQTPVAWWRKPACDGKAFC